MTVVFPPVERASSFFFALICFELGYSYLGRCADHS